MSIKAIMLPLSLLIPAFLQAQTVPPPTALPSTVLAATPDPSCATVLPPFLLLAPANRPASFGGGGGCHCLKTPAKTTALEGRGANCTVALTNLANATDSQVSANCSNVDGVCSEGDVSVTIACAFNPGEGGYSVTGYRSYTCRVCN